jgi:hypothetical protein
MWIEPSSPIGGETLRRGVSPRKFAAFGANVTRKLIIAGDEMEVPVRRAKETDVEIRLYPHCVSEGIRLWCPCSHFFLVASWFENMQAPGTVLMVFGAFVYVLGGCYGNEIICGKSSL